MHSQVANLVPLDQSQGEVQSRRKTGLPGTQTDVLFCRELITGLQLLLSQTCMVHQ